MKSILIVAAIAAIAMSTPTLAGECIGKKFDPTPVKQQTQVCEFDPTTSTAWRLVLLPEATGMNTFEFSEVAGAGQPDLDRQFEKALTPQPQ